MPQSLMRDGFFLKLWPGEEHEGMTSHRLLDNKRPSLGPALSNTQF
jgi:hypothetical protein